MFESDDVQQQQPAEDVRRPERRSVSVTPLDLRQCRFSQAFRGFDREEVASFLAEAASDYEGAVRDNERLREDLARLESSITQFRDLESSLKTALVSAQRVADDMRATAQAEAARIVREAEAKAELIQERAQSRLEDVQRELEGITLKRRHAITGIEATIATLHNTLDFINEQEAREHDERGGTAAEKAPVRAEQPAPAATVSADEARPPERVLPYQPREEAAARLA